MRSLILLFLFAVIVQSGAAGEPMRFGSVLYPAIGNIDSSEGSIICRFRIDEDLDKADSPCQPRKSPQWNRFVIFRVTLGTNSHMVLFWKPEKNNPGGMAVSLKIDGKSVLPPRDRNYRLSGKWRRGGIHTVALTWTKDKSISLWLDGVLTQKVNGNPDSVKTLGELDPRSARIELGARGGSSAIAVHALHVLDVPLCSAELGRNDGSLFAAHPASLLLDILEGQSFEPDGKTQTRATLISGYSGERGGVPGKNCVFGHDADSAFLKLYRTP